MNSTHILYNDGNRCVFDVITVYTCTHTHILTHIYKTELLDNGDQFTNCMQDVKQGSHPWLSTNLHHKSRCFVTLHFNKKTVKMKRLKV